ncbi:hypothetical protein KSP39_PZI013197 [Platanthera zijinensis]|uniref:Uncharacterized protein n=1 Tax=Platanthera zijinensis TaxID=2320716 RepID=A0AAP0BCL0_9ASPA
MSRVISTSNRAHRQGHCHALLGPLTALVRPFPSSALPCLAEAPSHRHLSHPHSSLSMPPSR